MSVEDLEKLAQLYERGLLTRDEFEKQKQSLLNASDAQGQSAASVVDRTSAEQPYATAEKRDPSKTKHKRSRIVRAFWGLLLFCAVAMLAAYLVMAPPGVDPPISALLTKALPMPKPVIVYQTASESPKSGIWDYVMRVSGEVQNTG